MRQITVPLPDLRKEALIAGACLMVAFALNIYAIIAFKTPWSEVFTSLPWVLGLALVFYLMAGGFRLGRLVIIHLIKLGSNTGKRP